MTSRKGRMTVGRGEGRMRLYAYLTGMTVGLVDALLATHVWTRGLNISAAIFIGLLGIFSLLGTLLAPSVCAHLGRRPLNCAGALSLGLGAIVITAGSVRGGGIGEEMGLYGVGYSLAGLGYGVLWSLLPLTAHELSLRGHARLVPRSTALIGLGGGVGIALGVLPSGLTLVALALCVSALTLLVLLSLLPESPSWYAARGRDIDAFQALRHLHGSLEAAIEIDRVRMDAEMEKEQHPLHLRDLTIPQVRSSLITALALVGVQEAPLAVAIVVFAPILALGVGGDVWLIGLFALLVGCVAVLALLVVSRGGGHRFMRACLGGVGAVIVSMMGVAIFSVRGSLDSWMIIVLAALMLAAQRIGIYPACHGAIDPRMPPWLVAWQTRSVVTLNVVARSLALLLGAGGAFLPGGWSLGLYFFVQCAALVVLLVRMPREFVQER